MATKKTPVAAASYTGVKVLEVPSITIDNLNRNKILDIPTTKVEYYPNQYIYLKASDNTKKPGVITRVDKDCKTVSVLPEKQIAFGVSPKNKEQTMALSALLDDDIKLLTLTGRAGTGKTILTIAAALEKAKKYDRIIITKPMSQVGRYDLGALPGEVGDKFGPYLDNYITNIQQLMGGNKKGKTASTQDIIGMYNIQAMPMQLIRGVSWVNTFIIADECQVLDKHEMLTLGTRIGEGSKLVIMGDLNQRDEDIKKEETGLYHIVNNLKMKQSPLTGHIELIKCERSALAELFAEAFED